VLPPLAVRRRWRLELETAEGTPPQGRPLAGGATLTLPARSIALLMEVGA